MNIYFLFFIAVSLAMDSFTVSIVNGIYIKNLRLKHILITAFSFGLFQGGMPIIGWVIGGGLTKFIQGFGEFFACLILVSLGIKMIYEAKKMEPFSRKRSNFNYYTVLILSLATSIDALAVGISFSFLKLGILMPAVIIGVITFIMSYAGISFGKKLGMIFGRNIELIGGICLIILGLCVFY